MVTSNNISSRERDSAKMVSLRPAGLEGLIRCYNQMDTWRQ
jgi:hypothetical protein